MGHCLITGASSGIGEALAYEYARHGHSLLLLGRNSDALKEIQNTIQAKYDVPVSIKPIDLTATHAVDEVLAWIDQSNVCVQHLVNNAGCGYVGAFSEVPCTHHLTVIDLNIRAVVALTHRLLPRMKSVGHATILNVSSMGAVLPGPYIAVYYASKAFMHSWSAALAFELKGEGVQVTTCAPGPVSTRFGERAGFKLSGRQRTISLDSKTVAQEAYMATMSGQKLCHPGRWMKCLRWLVPIMPKAILTRAMASVLQERLSSVESSD